jgi:hypothetical protein
MSSIAGKHPNEIYLKFFIIFRLFNIEILFRVGIRRNLFQKRDFGYKGQVGEDFESQWKFLLTRSNRTVKGSHPHH